MWAAGLLALAGAEMDLFALFAVVTFVGIGVDYGIHLVQRYREQGDAAAAIEELAPVILVAAGITVLGYGTLVTSSYPPLRSIGVVSAVSVAALSVASVLVLPALLITSTRRKPSGERAPERRGRGGSCGDRSATLDAPRPEQRRHLQRHADRRRIPPATCFVCPGARRDVDRLADDGQHARRAGG